MTANPARPARHRAGKPAGNVSSSDSDSEGPEAPPPPPAIPAPPKAASAGKIISNLSRIDLNARRQELETAAEARRLAAQRAEKLATEQGFVTEDEDGESGDDGSESGEESEDDESSEEEEPRRLMIRPKFVPKSQRGQASNDPEQEEEAARQAEEEARKKATDELVEEQIKKDLAARAAGKKHWDDEDNQDSDVDTTDGLDPEAEEAAWRVRELKRLKRARAAIEEREKELAEVERRRNLTAEERAAEDEAHLAKQREDKEGKGKMSYMQKYYHKGAFFQDETETAGLLQRDIMGSRFQDDVRNREALPEYLQKRDMTKLGRKGATKYKDMRTEDTGRWGQFDDAGPRGQRDRFDGDERFRPDDARFRLDDDGGPKGANAVPLRERRSKAPDGSKKHGARDDDEGDRGGGGSDDDHGHRRRSQSRSPRRDRDGYSSRRKRSTSRERDRYDDKRRRLDADVRR